MRICRVCKKECSRSDFHKDRAKKDGIRSECKACTRARGLEYRSHNNMQNERLEGEEMSGTNEYREYEGKPRCIGFRVDTGELFLQRCPECWRENYAMAVASGQCAWCGWKEQPTEGRGE